MPESARVWASGPVADQGFYGFPLAKYLPYAVTRTWHLQIGIFWIATSWLATGLYMAPAVSNQEPKGQRFGVNVLFVALVAVVVGSLAGEWASIEHKIGNLDLSWWLGTQGYEYVDLGRLRAVSEALPGWCAVVGIFGGDLLLDTQ